MKKENGKHGNATDLRERAEKKLKSGQTLLDNLTDADVRKLAHELQVHQIELEMQNEDLRRAQISIENARSEYMDLYDFAPVGYLTFNTDQQIVKANLTIAIMLGEERRNLNNKTFYQHIVKQDSDILYLHYQKVFESKKDETCELRFERRDGVLFYTQLNSTYVKDSEGNGFCRTSIIDITEKKQSEEKVILLSSAIEQCPVIVIITDHNGDIEYVNKEFENRTGYSFEEVIGKNPRLLKSGQQSYDVYVKLWSAITAGVEWKGRLCNRKKNGEFYREYRSISCVRDHNGNIKHFIAVEIDDTVRIKAEKEARKMERRYTKVLEISEDAIVSMDESQRIIIFNKGAERVFGYRANEIMGKAIETLIPERFRPNHKKNVESFGKSATNSLRLWDKSYELFGLKKDGTEFSADISISKFDEDGKVIHTAIVRDITQRRKLENEALKVQKLESLGVLAGGIAHDFNNILTAILGNTQLAMMWPGDEKKVYKGLKEIEKACMRAKGMARRLLTFAKGGLPVKKTFSIAELIKEAAGFAITGSNVKIAINIYAGLWLVEADEGQLNQVINNLIINAFQAMPNGGKIYINADNMTEDDSVQVDSLKNGRYIKISFKDQGVGIPENYIEKIFDPYFTTKQMGNGLGLSSAYSIIKNHGGLITVESELDVGTTFTVYISASSDEIAEKKAVEAKPVVGKGKILVMDDDNMIREMAHMMLTSLGYTFECVKDGDEAVKSYLKAREDGKPFDLLLLDLTIQAGIGGKETIRRLLEVDSETKAVVYSGYYNDPILTNFADYGFKAVVCKPFKISEMNDVLQSVINR